MKILIVEDNADDRSMLKYNLEHRGCEVIEASDGAEGLQMARAYKPGLIISDALMPVMDGFELLRRVKTDEKLKDIPFVFYSAVYTGYKEEELAISLGAGAFIVKPKDPEEFWVELNRILEACKLRKEKTVAAELIEEEEEFLRKYSQIVAAKLEEKVRELEQARATILKSEQCFKNLFNSLRDVVITSDTDRRILDANQSALRELFGYELEEIVGKKTRILYADDSGYNLTGKEFFDSKGFAKGKIIEVDFRKKNGEIFHGELYASILIDDDGQAIGNIGLIRDISEQRKLKAQLLQSQKMEAVGQLAGGVAHDFNNILTAIIGYGNLALMKMSEDDPLRLNIRNMLEGAERAAHLTKELLLFSRKQISERRPVDLNSIISKVEKFLKRVIGADVNFKTILSEQPIQVLADSHQLEQVLMNLVTNARDAMPEGGNVTVLTEKIKLNKDFTSAHGYGKAGTYVMVTVADSGHGMDEEMRQRIFEPFFTTKEVGKGTGLGLAVVYGIIKQHDGFINVYSEPGKGTTFKIYLPVIASMVREEETVVRKEEAPARGTETVLVAEDDEILRKLSRTVLTEFGYTVIEAVDGEDAVNKFMENKDKIQILLFDLIMPKMNGKDAYDEIRKIKPDMKVIFASGYAPDIARQKMRLEDSVHMLFKPMSPNELLRKLRSVLDETK